MEENQAKLFGKLREEMTAMLNAAITGGRAPEHETATAGSEPVPGCSKWDQPPPEPPAEAVVVAAPGPAPTAVPPHEQDHMYDPPDFCQEVEVEADYGGVGLDALEKVAGGMLDAQEEDSPDATLMALTQKVEDGTGAELEPAIAEACTSLIQAGLPLAKLGELLAKYQTPANCQIMAPVTVNASVWGILGQDTRARDLLWQRPQLLLAKAMVALSRAMADVKTAASDKPSLNGTFTTLAECFAILASSNKEINVKRRDLMKGDFSPAYKALCKQSAPITQLLFGDSLEEDIKCKCSVFPVSFFTYQLLNSYFSPQYGEAYWR